MATNLLARNYFPPVLDVSEETAKKFDLLGAKEVAGIFGYTAWFTFACVQLAREYAPGGIIIRDSLNHGYLRKLYHFGPMGLTVVGFWYVFRYLPD